MGTQNFYKIILNRRMRIVCVCFDFSLPLFLLLLFQNPTEHNQNQKIFQYLAHPTVLYKVLNCSQSVRESPHLQVVLCVTYNGKDTNQTAFNWMKNSLLILNGRRIHTFFLTKRTGVFL